MQTSVQHPSAAAGARPSTSPAGHRWMPTALALSAVVALAAVRLLDPMRGFDASDALSDWVTLSLSVLVESLPFVVLGIVVAIALRVWLPQGLLLERLPRSGVARRLVISLMGVLLPVCECGNVPVSRGFLLRGLGVGDALTFLVAAPVVNPVTIITTYQAFGFDDGVLVTRVLGALAIANLVGWLFSLHPQPERLLAPGFAAQCRVAGAERASNSLIGRLRASGGIFRHETADMMAALVMGAAIAGGIQVFVPRSTLIALGGDPLWSVLALMALAFIVSICSNVDAFFVLAFASVALPGGIVAFLIFGAIVDVKMLALLRTTLSGRALALLTTVVTLATLLIGLGVNALV